MLDKDFCGSLAALEFFGLVDGELPVEGEGGEDDVEIGGSCGCASTSSSALGIAVLVQVRRRRLR